MQLSFAPMEGISSRLYRQTHARLFGGVAEYFAPFIAPDGSGKFKASTLRDILPENNAGLRLIPQLLVNRAEPFLRVAGQLQELGYDNVFIETVEGWPSLETIIPKLKAKKIKQVTIMPFMMVAGDHANNDMAGSEEDSHKSILEKEGIKVETYIHGLGENEAVRNVFVERANAAWDALEK